MKNQKKEPLVQFEQWQLLPAHIQKSLVAGNGEGEGQGSEGGEYPDREGGSLPPPPVL